MCNVFTDVPDIQSSDVPVILILSSLSTALPKVGIASGSATQEVFLSFKVLTNWMVGLGRLRWKRCSFFFLIISIIIIFQKLKANSKVPSLFYWL